MSTNHWTDLDKDNIMEHTKDHFIFKRTSWAPGIWAGTEGVVINYEGIRYKILSVDLDRGILNVTSLGPECGAV